MPLALNLQLLPSLQLFHLGAGIISIPAGHLRSISYNIPSCAASLTLSLANFPGSPIFPTGAQQGVSIKWSQKGKQGQVRFIIG